MNPSNQAASSSTSSSTRLSLWNGALMKTRFSLAEIDFQPVFDEGQQQPIPEKYRKRVTRKRKEAQSDTQDQQIEQEKAEDEGLIRTRKRAKLIFNARHTSSLQESFGNGKSGLKDRRRSKEQQQSHSIGQAYLHQNLEWIDFSSFDNDEHPQTKRRKGKTREKHSVNEIDTNAAEEEENDDDEQEAEENGNMETEETLLKRIENRKRKNEVEIDEIAQNLPDESLLNVLQNMSSHYYHSRQMLNNHPSDQRKNDLNDDDDENTTDKEQDDEIEFGMLHACEGNALVAMGIFVEELIKWEANAGQTRTSKTDTSTIYQRLQALKSKERGFRIKQGGRNAIQSNDAGENG